MLRCRGGAFYVGHTDNLERRMDEHHSSVFPGFTATRLPVALIWSECFSSRLETLETEQRIMGWSRAKKMALVRGDWDLISRLAKKQCSTSTSSVRTGGYE